MKDEFQAPHLSFRWTSTTAVGDAPNQARMENHQQSISASTLHTPVLPGLPDSIRRIINATYAAHGGAEHMTLDEWRDLEQQLKRRLQNEQHDTLEAHFFERSRF